MNRKFVVLGLVVIAVLFISYYFDSITGFLVGKAVVARIIDGDTIELSNGEVVRLLGIDTPERGQYYFDEAKIWLKNKIENKSIILEKDKEDKDKYERSLRYVFLDDFFTNLELVRLGYAKLLIIPPNEKYSEEFKKAEDEARNQNLGIWKIDIHNAFCMGIFYLHYNAEGKDNENLNDEYVIFRNSCNYSIDITGWILKDRANNTYIFPYFSFPQKERITLHTGSGDDNKTDLYWNNKKPVWNNNGDSLFLWRGRELLLNYTY